MLIEVYIIFLSVGGLLSMFTHINFSLFNAAIWLRYGFIDGGVSVYCCSTNTLGIVLPTSDGSFTLTMASVSASYIWWLLCFIANERMTYDQDAESSFLPLLPLRIPVAVDFVAIYILWKCRDGCMFGTHYPQIFHTRHLSFYRAFKNVIDDFRTFLVIILDLRYETITSTEFALDAFRSSLSIKSERWLFLPSLLIFMLLAGCCT